MFQSSRTASGSWRWHSPNACSPSSASVISNSKPSRIRRATLRMTLESSTTRQVFIAASFFPCGQSAVPRCCSHPRLSRRERIAAHVEHAIHVEDDEKLSFQPMYAGRDAREARVEIDRVCFAGVVRKLEHLADGVDEKPVGLTLDLDADRHRRSVLLALRQPEPAAHV